jgi:hypothetical protein
MWPCLKKPAKLFTSDVDGRLAGCVCKILVVGKIVEVNSSVLGLIITNVLATDCDWLQTRGLQFAATTSAICQTHASSIRSGRCT